MLPQLTSSKLFHLANQAEMRISKDMQKRSQELQEISEKTQKSTAEVAKQTARDSTSMIVIATLTLFFLPGTFVSSILSTTFFSYSDNGPQVSHRGWILAPVIVPFTFLVFGLWLVWLKRNRPGAYQRALSWPPGAGRGSNSPA